MNFSELFIRRPIMTLLLTISITVFGIQVFRQLPVNDLPAVDYPVIQVNVTYPGASPETMANTCATPLEKQFLQIPGLELVTSTSQTGQSTLLLQFSLDKSLGDAATDVQAAISRAQGFLPTDLPQPPSFQKTNPNDQPIFYIGYGEAPAEVVLAVSRQAGANAVEVAQKVKDLLPTFRQQLPGSVQLIPLYDRSKTIIANATDVEHTLLIAFTLVVLVIFVFLGRATDTLIPVVALPLSMLVTDGSPP